MTLTKTQKKKQAKQLFQKLKDSLSSMHGMIVHIAKRHVTDAPFSDVMELEPKAIYGRTIRFHTKLRDQLAYGKPNEEVIQTLSVISLYYAVMAKKLGLPDALAMTEIGAEDVVIRRDKVLALLERMPHDFHHEFVGVACVLRTLQQFWVEKMESAIGRSLENDEMWDSFAALQMASATVLSSVDDVSECALDTMRSLLQADALRKSASRSGTN